MKRCNTCGQEKPLSDYYKHPQMADGHMGNCKECQKAASKAAREARKEYYLMYDRQRANRPDRVAARLAYKGTDQGRERLNAGKAAWIDRNPEKRAAHSAVSNAVRDGRLIKQPCEVCGNPEVHAHHDDYSKPLEVRWLCIDHHIEHHVAERSLPILKMDET